MEGVKCERKKRNERGGLVGGMPCIKKCNGFLQLILQPISFNLITCMSAVSKL